MISSHGFGDSEIFFLGGVPSKDDLASGLALSGQTEFTLNTFLREHGLQLKNCWRSLYVKEPIYNGLNRRLLRNELAQHNTQLYEHLLLEELKSVSPNIIVTLDDLALSVVFPHINSLTLPRGRKFWSYCYRGSLLPLRPDWQAHFNSPIKIIPTIGPRLLAIDWTARAYVATDFAKILKYRYSKSPIAETTLRWVTRSARDFLTFIERSLPSAKFLVFDIETYGGLLTCIGFSFDGYEGVSVPLVHDKTISQSEIILMWTLVSKLLAHPIPKVNQNIKYDWTILDRHGFHVENVTGDTMLAGSLLYPELPKGLDFYTSIYTDIPYYKDEGKEFDPKSQSYDKLFLYNAQDAIATHQIHTKQLTELAETGALELYEKELVPLIQIYKDIDSTGILVDELAKAKLNEKYTKLYRVNLAVLQELTGDPNFNPKSFLQVGKFLYEELKYPKRTKVDPESGESRYRTDKECLDDLSINHSETNRYGKLGSQILSRIIACRKIAKIIDYINTAIHADGRWRGTSNLAGTETGRSSFSKTLDEIITFEFNAAKKAKSPFKIEKKRLGRSLQTITKHGFIVDEELFEEFEDREIAQDVRSMFVPDKGFAFVEVDGSGAEARVVALLSEDYDLLNTFDAKPKVHARTAGLIFDIDSLTITKSSPTIPKLGIPYYDLGKRIRHAGNYKMGAARLSQMSHLPMRECDLLLEKFHQTNPNIRLVFHENVIEQVRKYRVLRTPFGRRRDFFARLDDNIYKEAIAYLPQSYVSDLTKFSLPRILTEFPEAIILSEQHDGILALIRKEKIYEYLEIAKRIMERSINFSGCSLSRDYNLTIPIEASIGKENWQEMEDIDLKLALT